VRLMGSKRAMPQFHALSWNVDRIVVIAGGGPFALVSRGRDEAPRPAPRPHRCREHGRSALIPDLGK
jgi:hypothetical protein